VYDRRIAKVVDLDGNGAAPAEVERFVYEGDNISLVFDGQGDQLHRYLHGPAVDQILADETSTSVNWALVDNLGSVRDIVDSDGVLLNHISYDSFGQVTSELNPDVDFRFGYTGRELDEETGLYYYRARYYDGSVGEFLGEDPMSFWADDYNLSRYTFNSPINFTDPSGMLLFLAPAVPVVVGGGLTTGQAVVGGRLLVGAGYFLGKGVKDAADWLTRPQPMPDTDPQTEADREKLERIWRNPSSNRNPNRDPNPQYRPDPFPVPTPIDPNCDDDKKPQPCSKDKGIFLGGSYNQVKSSNSKGTPHHAPSWSSIRDSNIQLGKQNKAYHDFTPTVCMSSDAHKATASYKGANHRYKPFQLTLINSGKFNEAQNLDVVDIQRKFGHKYDVGILQMLNFTLQMQAQHPSWF
jgi:RHS repeat-associated protein